IVRWTPEFVFALCWLVFVLSFGAIWLLYFLISRAAATKVVSLFYLTPPVTALIALGLFNERMAVVALLGMAFCIAGVILVNLKLANGAAGYPAGERPKPRVFRALVGMGKLRSGPSSRPAALGRSESRTGKKSGL